MASYICIDLKSFYASVECVERGLDPLNTNLVVAGHRQNRKDHLSRRNACAEKVRHSRKSKAF